MAFDGHQSMRGVHVLQTDGEADRRQARARGLGPLHEADRVVEVRLEVAPLGGRDRGEAEEVEVRVGHAAAVAVPDREGRARDGTGDAERAARAADEGRLAGAELARDGDDVAGDEPRRERCGQRLRLLGREVEPPPTPAPLYVAPEPAPEPVQLGLF